MWFDFFFLGAYLQDFVRGSEVRETKGRDATRARRDSRTSGASEGLTARFFIGL